MAEAGGGDRRAQLRERQGRDNILGRACFLLHILNGCEEEKGEVGTFVGRCGIASRADEELV